MLKFLSKTPPSRLKGIALLRLDFNTQDEWRLDASMPTVKFLCGNSNSKGHADKVVIMSHRGRPAGVPDKKLSLRADAEVLAARLGRPVTFLSRLEDKGLGEKIAEAPRGSIFLLENLRFAKGEADNETSFSRWLASLADYYVNEAFAVSHRSAASVVGVTKLLPSYAGLGLENEIKALSGVLKNPEKPLVLVIGGVKAHDKLGVIRRFKEEAQAMLIGGGSGNTLLYLNGVNVGESVFDKDPRDLRALKEVVKYDNLFAPVDWKTSGGRILDIGPKTIQLFVSKISSARTIIWSGPMGLVEDKRFEVGNLAVARAMARNAKAFSLTGGGETVSFLKKHGLDKKFSFISTGGGAFLEFISGKELPGIKALKKNTLKR